MTRRRTRRRRVAAAAFAAAGPRLRARPDLRGARAAAGRTSARSTTSPTTPTSRRRSRSSTGIGEAGKIDRLRAQAQPADRHRQAPRTEYDAVRRDLHALHAPRLPGALRRRRAALHLPVPRRRLRLPGQGRRRPAGAPARPLLHARRDGRVSSARATRSTRELERFSPRDPGEPLDGIGQYLYPSRPSVRKLATDSRRPCPSSSSPAPPLPQGPEPARRAGPGNGPAATPLDHAKEAGTTVVDWVDERTSLSRRRALADVPQGPEGDQLVLHAGLGDDVRLPLPGRHRRLPGDVLRPVADPRLRVGALHHQRGVPRRVRARHAQVGLVGDGDPRLPAHGAGRSSSAPTSTRAS